MTPAGFHVKEVTELYAPEELELEDAWMYLDLVVFADGRGADAVLLAQVLGQPGRHGLPEHVGGAIEMAFEAYAAVRGHQGMGLSGEGRVSIQDGVLEKPLPFTYRLGSGEVRAEPDMTFPCSASA